MTAYQRGDLQAFDELFRLLSPRLYGWLVRQARDRTVADDLLQEVFLNIHRARATYRPGAPVLAWAFAIARHALVSRGRREGRRAKREEPKADLALLAGPVPEDPPVDPRAEKILAALEELPANQREAVTLLKVEGMSVKEVAAATGATPGAVKLRAHRAYETLRKKVGGSEEGPG